MISKEWSINQTVWKLKATPTSYGTPIMAKNHRDSWVNVLKQNRGLSFMNTGGDPTVVVTVDNSIRLRLI